MPKMADFLSIELVKNKQGIISDGVNDMMNVWQNQ